ncbi:MAG: 30S ribosomal protein S9 [Candidatus Paceibacterota bacterium]|jgi:small subunit ribosomal protein S9
MTEETKPKSTKTVAAAPKKVVVQEKIGEKAPEEVLHLINESAFGKKEYIEAIGRRKTSVARGRVFKATKDSITVNGKDFTEYFPTESLQSVVREPMTKGKISNKFKITAVINGGGISSQAQALRHAISRVFVALDVELRKPLKKSGLLKRDPRAKERRKFGLKKARKAPQWSKR